MVQIADFFNPTIKKILFIISAIICSCLPGYPSVVSHKEVNVMLIIIDNLTENRIYHPTLTITNLSDTTDTRITRSHSLFRVLHPDCDHRVIISTPHYPDDYSFERTEYVSDTIILTSKELMSSNGELISPEIRLKRKYGNNTIHLNEVTVTASKVTFYHRGDTIIYNADAFVTPQGSKLDALISQMPGVKIDQNGVITANGRRVDNLLLNGKDLFRGNRTILLENLPAYTVKDIAIYEKLSDIGEFLGEKIGDEKYVMDVRLKRDYHVGKLGNIEVGYGTRKKYLARLFTLRFSDNIQLSTHLNANNLSDLSKSSGSNSSWTPASMEQGVKTARQGGLNYNADKLPHQWSASGSVELKSDLTTSVATTLRYNYYPGADIHDRIFENNKSRFFDFLTRHYLRKNINKSISWQITPEFQYTHNRYNDKYAFVSFDGSVKQPSYDIDSAHIARRISESCERRNSVKTGLSTSLSFKPRNTAIINMIGIGSSLYYRSASGNKFDKLDIDLSDTAPQLASRYFKTHPDYTINYSCDLHFLRKTSRISLNNLSLILIYSGESSVYTSELYMLNHVTGFDWQNSPLGVLPSTSQYLEHIDLSQSYSTNYHTDNYCLKFDMLNSFKNKICVIDFNGGIKIFWLHRRFDYCSEDAIQHVTRNRMFYDIDISTGFTFTGNRQSSGSKDWTITLRPNITATPQQITMLDAVQRVNTTDPLYLKLGNTDLKDAYRYTFGFSITNEIYRTKILQNLKFRFEVIDNAIAHARYYNQISGITISRPINIDGNRGIFTSYDLSTPLFRKTQWLFATTTYANFIRSRDISTTIQSDRIDIVNSDAIQTVTTSTLGENLNLTWQNKGHSVTASADMRYNRYRSVDMDFDDFSSRTMRYRMSGIIAIPDGWGVSTDINLYTRHGFSDSRFNTSDLVWNARITKSLMKGALILAMDAYDILKQLNNISYTVNAQARTEIKSNVVPSYVLFHVQYRFNHSPNKK